MQRSVNIQLSIIFLAYFSILLTTNLLRFYGFDFNIGDFGTFYQLMHNTANGDFLSVTTQHPFTAETNWFGIHFTVLNFLIALPIFKLIPLPETLLTLHVLAMSATFFPIYYALRQLKLEHDLALLFAVCYLLNPFIINATLFSFQDHSLYVPIIALTFYTVIAKRFKETIILSVLLILAKEHLGLTVCGFGILWGFYHKEVKQSLILITIGLTAFIVIVFVIMPHFSATHEHYMLSPNMPKTFMRYQWLTLPYDKIIQVIPQILTHQNNLNYYALLLLPFLLLPLIGIIFVFPVAPDFFANILSTLPIPTSMEVYHSSGIIPGLVIASAFAFIFLRNRFKDNNLITRLPTLILIVHVLFAINIAMKLSHSYALIGNKEMVWSFNDSLKDVKQKISKDAKVIVFDGNGVGPHLANRRDIYPSYAGLDKGDTYVFLLSPYRFTINGRTSRMPELYEVGQLLDSKQWGITYFNKNWLIFEKDKPSKFEKQQVLDRLKDFM